MIAPAHAGGPEENSRGACSESSERELPSHRATVFFRVMAPGHFFDKGVCRSTSRGDRPKILPRATLRPACNRRVPYSSSKRNPGPVQLPVSINKRCLRKGFMPRPSNSRKRSALADASSRLARIRSHKPELWLKPAPVLLGKFPADVPE
jgi:hypothetical protein